ncbi:MAG: 30S ribosomal protein S3 [Candidatus Doudnabacteria bacterium]|nr:30S ribosomal protein S3 [Candidatus Doudnabacteria bacterium]
MGHKINPTSIRLNITQSWKSRWFAKSSIYAKLLEEDVKIREYLEKHLKKAGLVRLDIERTGDGMITVVVKTTKPGLIIGKGGAGIEELKKKIRQKLGIKKELKVNIEEMRDINLQAQSIANGIAEQIEKRVAFRKLMKQSLEQIMNAGAKGAKVAIGGRLNGAEIARTEHLGSGKIPLHTLRADIDFARSTAFTTYGTVGIKVWIYKGDVFQEKNVAARTKLMATDKVNK